MIHVRFYVPGTSVVWLMAIRISDPDGQGWFLAVESSAISP